MDGGAWWAAVHGVAKSQTLLSDFTFTFHFHALEKEIATQLQCSCLENPRDRGAWWAAVYGVAQSQTRLKRLSSSSSSGYVVVSHCGFNLHFLEYLLYFLICLLALFFFCEVLVQGFGLGVSVQYIIPSKEHFRTCGVNLPYLSRKLS